MKKLIYPSIVLTSIIKVAKPTTIRTKIEVGRRYGIEPF